MCKFCSLPGNGTQNNTYMWKLARIKSECNRRSHTHHGGSLLPRLPLRSLMRRGWRRWRVLHSTQRLEKPHGDNQFNFFILEALIFPWNVWFLGWLYFSEPWFSLYFCSNSTYSLVWAWALFVGPWVFNEASGVIWKYSSAAIYEGSPIAEWTGCLSFQWSCAIVQLFHHDMMWLTFDIFDVFCISNQCDISIL